MPSFVVLHLSDLHFDALETEAVPQARRTIALQGLIRTLSDLVNMEPELRPNALVISGDIAYRGSRPDYDLAEVWIRQLLQALDLTSLEVIAAAGNHDLDRTTATQVSRPTDHREADDLLGVPADGTLNAAFAEYEAFCERLGIPPLQLGKARAWLVGSRSIGGVRFVVLNSAWLARDKEDAGRLWLGQPQFLVMEASEQVPSLNRDFSAIEIAIFHHPPEDLAEPERNAFGNRPATFRYLAARVDLILTGHSHVQDLREPDQIGMQALHFVAGAAYEHNEYRNHVRLFHFDTLTRQVEVIGIVYDPLTQHWEISPTRRSYNLRTSADIERLRMTVKEGASVSEDSAAVSESDRESDWHRLVDQARDLLRSGKSAAARAILLDIRSKPEAQAFSAKLRFRIATNLGSSAIELDDFETAIKELDEALDLERTAASLANAALAHLGAGDTATALKLSREAVAVDPTSDNAIFINLKTLAAANLYGEIDEFAAGLTEERTSLGIALALADSYGRRGNHALGERWARRAVALQGDHPFANLLLAENILADINESDDRQPGTISSAILRRLDEAEMAVAVALRVFGDDDHSARLNVAMNIRAGVAALRGDFAECVRYADQVLARDPANDIARQNRGVALYELDRYQEAIVTLGAIQNANVQEMVALPLADAYLKTGEPGKASDTLRPFFHPEQGGTRQLQSAEVLLHAAINRQDMKGVEELSRVVSSAYLDNPIASALLANKDFSLGKHNAAIHRLEEVISKAALPDRRMFSLQLARMYHDVDRYDESITFYEAAFDQISGDSPQIDRYVHALFQVGRRGRALEVARLARSVKGAVGKIAELEAEILKLQGDVSSAASLFDALSKAEPDEIAHRTRHAEACARIGRRGEARAIVEGISLQNVKGKSDRLFEVARLRAILEMPDVLLFAYYGRRAEFSTPEAHEQYMLLFNGLDPHEEASLQASVIAVGTTAYLVGTDGEKNVSIIEEFDELRSPNEVHASAPLAKLLLGHRPGEEVVIKRTSLETQVVTVREVVSNYVWAFRETAENFTTWFPDSPFMQRGGNDPESLARIAKHLERQDGIMRTLVDAYKAREISLPFFAEHAGMRVTDAWWRLWRDPDMPIRVRSNTPPPALKDRQMLVVELTALITFALLDLLPALRKRFRLVVSQHVLDAVGEEVFQVRMNGLSSIALYNAMLDAEKAAALDQARQQHAFFVGLRGFVETETERLVSTSWLNLPPAIVDQRERVFGLSGSHSLLVARDHGLPLLVDDSITRELASREERIVSASSWNILKELHRAALVTSAELTSAEGKLRHAGYDEIEGAD